MSNEVIPAWPDLQFLAPQVVGWPQPTGKLLNKVLAGVIVRLRRLNPHWEYRLWDHQDITHTLAAKKPLLIPTHLPRQQAFSQASLQPLGGSRGCMTFQPLGGGESFGVGSLWHTSAGGAGALKMAFPS